MKVTLEEVDALNAIIKVEVAPSDYQEKVKSTLNNYRKNAKVPGFRPGNVPFGYVQKQYGKAVLSEELNKLVGEALNRHIVDNKLNVLGNPIPRIEDGFVGDIEKPDTFQFNYDIGLSPTFNVGLSSKSNYDYMKVKVDDKLIDEQVNDLRRRYGKLSSGEKVGPTDLVLGQFVELRDDGSILEGGIMHSSTISLEFIEDKATKDALIGKVVGDKVEVDPTKVSRGGKDTAAMLGIKEEELDSISSRFQLTVTDIKVMQLAELTDELFTRLFGEGSVSNEKELRERVKSDLGGMFVADSDKLLTRAVYEDLIENTKLDLPDAFLKRWIKMSNEKQITDEQIELEYDSYAKGLKWQLIQGEIFKVNEIKLEDQEALAFTKGLIANNYAQYGMPAPEDAELTSSAINILKNKEEASRIYDMLAENKLTNFFKQTVKLNEKEISYDDFVKLAGK